MLVQWTAKTCATWLTLLVDNARNCKLTVLYVGTYIIQLPDLKVKYYLPVVKMLCAHCRNEFTVVYNITLQWFVLSGFHWQESPAQHCFSTFSAAVAVLPLNSNAAISAATSLFNVHFSLLHQCTLVHVAKIVCPGGPLQPLQQPEIRSKQQVLPSTTLVLPFIKHKLPGIWPVSLAPCYCPFSDKTAVAASKVFWVASQQLFTRILSLN